MTTRVNIAFVCPGCEKPIRVQNEGTEAEFACPHCRRQFPLFGTGDSLDRCSICGCNELFVRKDFSQRVGLSIVVVGFALSSIAWARHQIYWTYGILFATAMIDVVLYFTVKNLLQCYRCSTLYRGLSGLDNHSTFSLETHERFRQQSARLSEVSSER